MKLKNLALASALALAIVGGSQTMALAQPGTDACNDAKTAVDQAQKRFDNKAAEERVAENAALDAAKDALRLARDTVDDPATDVNERKTAIDSAQGLVDLRQGELDTDSRQLAELRAVLTVAIDTRDDDCAEEPAPSVDDKDCSDFANQADAQAAMGSDDRFNLDENNNGIACEAFFAPPPPPANNDNDDDNNAPPQVVVVPQGGVATGDGSLA